MYHQTVLYVRYTGFSQLWFRHASIDNFSSIFSKSLKSPIFHPEFDAVVSKTNARTWSARRYFCAMANMAFAYSCSISDETKEYIILFG